MIESYEFLKLVTDSINEHIVVIDRVGNIQFFNKAWAAFGWENSASNQTQWQEINYLKVCDDSAAMGDEFGAKAAQGIREVIRQERNAFYLEYPCHGPDEKRWFMMRVTPCNWQGNPYFIISHQNITERKLAEEATLKLSRIDGLTNIANRRYFDEFLDMEWRHCARLKLPISLAIMDLDHFKLLNDYYGHLAGDDCLKKIGEVLNQFCNRPGDICARYGGEEFALVFGNTMVDESLALVNKLVDAIEDLKIPNVNSPIKPTVTVSVGLAMMYPNPGCTAQDLIRVADRLLYQAKEGGRNRVMFEQGDQMPAEFMASDRFDAVSQNGTDQIST